MEIFSLSHACQLDRSAFLLLLRSFRSWFSCVILTMIVVCIPVIEYDVSAVCSQWAWNPNLSHQLRRRVQGQYQGTVPSWKVRWFHRSLILNLELGPFGHIWTIMLEEVWRLCNGERHSFFQRIKDTGDFENCCLKGMATSRTFWVHPR